MAWFGRKRDQGEASGGEPAPGSGPAPETPGSGPAPAPAAPGSAEEQAAENARTCVRMFAEEWDVQLDFSPASIAALDSLAGEFHRRGEPLPEPVGALSAWYLAEVVRKEFGGEYFGTDEAPGAVLVVGGPETGVAVHAYEKVFSRARNGEEDDLRFFHDGISGNLGTPGLSHLI